MSKLFLFILALFQVSSAQASMGRFFEVSLGELDSEGLPRVAMNGYELIELSNSDLEEDEKIEAARKIALKAAFRECKRECPYSIPMQLDIDFVVPDARQEYVNLTRRQVILSFVQTVLPFPLAYFTYSALMDAMRGEPGWSFVVFGGWVGVFRFSEFLDARKELLSLEIESGKVQAVFSSLRCVFDSKNVEGQQFKELRARHAMREIKIKGIKTYNPTCSFCSFKKASDFEYTSPFAFAGLIQHWRPRMSHNLGTCLQLELFPLYVG